MARDKELYLVSCQKYHQIRNTYRKLNTHTHTHTHTLTHTHTVTQKHTHIEIQAQPRYYTAVPQYLSLSPRERLHVCRTWYDSYYFQPRKRLPSEHCTLGKGSTLSLTVVYLNNTHVHLVCLGRCPGDSPRGQGERSIIEGLMMAIRV